MNTLQIASNAKGWQRLIADFMKLTGINPDSGPRAKLENDIRLPVKLALQNGSVSVEEVVFLITRMLTELADGAIVHGHLLASYDLSARRGQQPALGNKHFVKSKDNAPDALCL